MEELKAT